MTQAASMVPAGHPGLKTVRPVSLTLSPKLQCQLFLYCVCSVFINMVFGETQVKEGKNNNRIKR